VLPEVRSLSDGGIRVAESSVSGTCELAGAARTTAINFANGPAATCARAANDLER